MNTAIKPNLGIPSVTNIYANWLTLVIFRRCERLEWRGNHDKICDDVAGKAERQVGS